MGLSDAMQWWDQWKLRVLVLCSLSVQLFLPFSRWMRTYYKLRRLRVLLWMAHIGGDALAIYALATLFNRQKQLAYVGSDALELIWVPILLIHLGGQDSISAYSLEDNELWMRHTITLVSQVSVALYIFCKWWSGQKKLLEVSVLLFVVGILKFSEKPFALKSASFNSIVSRSLSKRRERKSIPLWWTWLSTMECMGFLLTRIPKGEEEHQRNLSLEDYVEAARRSVQETKVESDQPAAFKKWIAGTMDYISMMLVDLSTRYSIRLNYLQDFLKLDDEHDHKLLKAWVMITHGILYTKWISFVTCFGCCSWLLLPFLAIASLVLFAKSDKDDYNCYDIRVSYIMLGCTVVIQFLPLLLMPFDIWGRFKFTVWQDMVSQHNLMSFCARKKQPTTLMKLAAFKCLREYINKHWYNWQVPAAFEIERLICQYIKDGWKEFIHDPATYRRFNSLWGQQALSRHPQLGRQLGWSLELPFDEIVLVWHIATDLCFHHPADKSSQSPSEDKSSQSRSEGTTLRSRQISSYMIHLLFLCPEMLMPGTTQDLFTVACDDIEDILMGENDPPSIAQRILHMEHDEEHKGYVVPKACKLAKELMKHPDEKQRWMVIQGVWVEMLCYSAGRCRGYLHAKSLGYGGEFLTNVWFLWSLMGMEILGDKIHMPGQPLQEEGITGAPV